jgi:hypothetical protein
LIYQARQTFGSCQAATNGAGLSHSSFGVRSLGASGNRPVQGLHPRQPAFKG